MGWRLFLPFTGWRSWHLLGTMRRLPFQDPWQVHKAKQGAPYATVSVRSTRVCGNLEEPRTDELACAPLTF